MVYPFQNRSKLTWQRKNITQVSLGKVSGGLGGAALAEYPADPPKKDRFRGEAPRLGGYI